MKRKVELIQQIRAMEALPKDRTKLVDWTATAGHALLSEMSIAEVSITFLIVNNKQNLSPSFH